MPCYLSLAGEDGKGISRRRLGSTALRAEAKPAQFLLQPRSDVLAVEGEGEIGAEEPESGAAIISAPVEAHAVKGLGAGELDHAVGELDFAARSLFHQLEDLKDLGLKDVAPRNDEVGGRCSLLRL